MRATRIILVVAAFAGVFGVPSARSQIAPGLSGSLGTRAGVPEEFWWSLRQMGDCFAKTKTKQAKALLATEARSDAEVQAANALMGSETACLRHGNRMRLSTDMLRGTIAEALYEREFRTPPPAVPASFSGDAASLEFHHLLAVFADCLSSAHPEKVHHVLKTTKLGTKSERAGLAELTAEFEQCLPSNQEIRLDASDVRIALAEALYRRSLASAATQAKAN